MKTTMNITFSPKADDSAPIELTDADMAFIFPNDPEFAHLDLFSAEEIEAMDENKVIPTDAESFSLIFGY